MECINLEQITDLFKCKYCHKCYDNPIVLPCGDKLCKSHLNQIYNQVNDSEGIIHLQCPYCQDSIIEPKNGFPEDREMKKLIEIGLDKLSFGEVFNKSKQSVEELAERMKNLETISNDPREFVKGYFGSLRNQLDERMDKCKKNIDQSYENISKEIDGHEKECLLQVRIGSFEILIC